MCQSHSLCLLPFSIFHFAIMNFAKNCLKKVYIFFVQCILCCIYIYCANISAFCLFFFNFIRFHPESCVAKYFTFLSYFCRSENWIHFFTFAKENIIQNKEEYYFDIKWNAQCCWCHQFTEWLNVELRFLLLG